ncbi:17931_t:CDS:2, partial [Funneliformis geosporum]
QKDTPSITDTTALPTLTPTGTTTIHSSASPTGSRTGSTPEYLDEINYLFLDR